MCNSKAQVFIAFFLISAGGKEAARHVSSRSVEQGSVSGWGIPIIYLKAFDWLLYCL